MGRDPLDESVAGKASPASVGRWVLALVLLTAGLITLPTPVPIGLALLAGGSAVLITASPAAWRAVCRLRARYPGMSRRLQDGGRYLPGPLARVLARTDPEGRD